MAHKFGFLVAQDAAYSELYFDDKRASFMSLEGGNFADFAKSSNDF